LTSSDQRSPTNSSADAVPQASSYQRLETGSSFLLLFSNFMVVFYNSLLQALQRRSRTDRVKPAPTIGRNAMPVDQNAHLRITTLDQVPRFARGYVRDVRVRWACEEIDLPYATRPVSALSRPADYYARQPWGQVPAIEDDGLDMFESGAILLHLGERDERLLPRDREGRARALSWLFAAHSSVEPLFMELASVDIFNAGEQWATLRRPGLLEAIGQRL